MPLGSERLIIAYLGHTIMDSTGNPRMRAPKRHYCLCVVVVNKLLSEYMYMHVTSRNKQTAQQRQTWFHITK